MSDLSKETVLKLAKLARIKIDEEKIDLYKENINNIMNWINILNEVDLATLHHIHLKEPLAMPKRMDQVTDGNNPDAVLKNAPKAMYGMFSVPKVIE